MRAALALSLGGAAALVGVGLYARPGEPVAAAGGGIVVVRGGAPASPVARAVPVAIMPTAEVLPAAAEAEDHGDPGVWALPAEWAPSEPTG